MEIIYGNKTVENLCTDEKYAKKKLGINIYINLRKKIEFINQSENLHDIIMYRPFNFHNLKGNLKGKCSLDIAGRQKGYRLIIEPLDSDGRRYKKMNIDEISKSTKMILVIEVSDHYE